MRPGAIRCGTVHQKRSPLDRRKSGAARDVELTGCRDDDGRVTGITANEFAKAGKISLGECAGLDLDGPGAPAAVEHRVDLKRLLAPIAHRLTAADREGEARVLDPSAPAGGIDGRIRRAIGMNGRCERIVEHDQLRRSVALTRDGREPLDGRNEGGITEQREVRRHRLDGTSIVQRALQFLQRDYLRR